MARWDANQADHLCCGHFGRVDVLLTAGVRLVGSSAADAARQIAARVVERARRLRHFRLSTPGFEYRVFDAGLFSAQVANQSTVLGIDPARPAQFNGAYMVVYFIGGSAGTAAGGSLIDLTGWAGIALTATAALTVAASIVLLSGRPFMADRG